MAVNIQQARKPGRCDRCGGTIGVGADFVWGPYGSRERYHADCDNTAPVAEDTTDDAPLSVQQLHGVKWALEGTGHGCMDAVAGSGKTFTLKAIAKALRADRPGVTIKFLVFNNRNAEEASKKMPKGVDVSTFHSTGYQAVRQRLDLKSKPTDKKLGDLLSGMVDAGTLTPREMDNLGGGVIKLTALGKRHGVAAICEDTEAKWLDLMDHYDVTVDAPPEDYPNGMQEAEARTVQLARLLLKASNQKLDVVDFDDMLYLVLLLNLTLPRFDFVLVDEAQDTNPARRAMLRLMLKPGGRLLVVGDKRQAIYGFTGAENDALDRLVTEFACTRLPLSVNYRCGRKIIEAAKAHCPEIEACDDAPEGTVEYMPALSMKDFKAGDAVLCRVTAPLITLAYRGLAARIAGDVDYVVKVLGRDIATGLTSLVKKLQGKRKTPLTLEQMLDKLDAWETREVARWTAKGDDEKVQSAQDKAASIRAAADALPEDRRTVAGLVEGLESLFVEGGDVNKATTVTLSTVHKSKGMEWGTVYILDPHRMPSAWARQAWQMEQEENLIYVATTRAKETLRYVSMEDIAS